MANEFFAVGGSDIAIWLTPGGSGILQVFIDGDKIFDKAEEGGHPNLDRVKEMNAVLKARLSA